MSSIRDSHFIYEGLRKAFLLGLRVKPILKALDLKSEDTLLDAGCGYGYFVRHCNGSSYTGVDSDPTRIEWAKAHVGESKKRHFVAADICNTGFPGKSFDKAIGYGLLHHLSDDAAQTCLKELARLVKGYVVFSDPVYTPYHWINNRLCDLDRGDHVRNANGYRSLCEPLFNVVSAKYFYARNGLAKYYLMTAAPKQ